MKKLLHNNILIVDDDTTMIINIKMILNDPDGKKIISEEDIKFLKEYLKDNEPPDLIISDICLKPGESELVVKKNKTIDDYTSLSDISGIKFLTYLRNNFHKLPVIANSGYWENESYLPQLSQHALCFIKKNNFDEDDIIRKIFWTAQQAVIGIQLHSGFNNKQKKIFKTTIDEINDLQNHFYFVVCETNKDLIKPPFLDIKNTDIPLYPQLFETWNNRILGIMEDEELKLNEQSLLKTALPFSRNRTIIIPNKLKFIVDYMGDDFLPFFLIRECAKAAYLIFFDLEYHFYDSNKCLFGNSNDPMDLLPLEHYNTNNEFKFICNKCFRQIKNINTYGGWNSGKTKAVNNIAETALEKLKLIE